jgi:uncharacterized membrane protein YdjX (TVP38/TMEM64 family)
MQQLKQVKLKTLLIFLSLIAISATSIFLTFYYKTTTTDWFKILILGSFLLLFIAFFITYYKKTAYAYKLLFTSIYLGSIVLIVFVLLRHFGLIKLLESGEEVRDFILSTGNNGRLVFMFIQFAQVALIPIPAMVTTLAGVAIYGAFEAFILSTIAIILGALFAFFVWGRLFGYRLVKWIVGKEKTDKYRDILNQRGKYLFVLMMLLPIFPDDILCMVAGITTMSSKFFVLTTIIIRPITTFFICYFSGGQIIPYSGWGLIAWPILLVLMAVLFVWTYKNNDKIEQYFTNLQIFKKSNK